MSSHGHLGRLHKLVPQIRAIHPLGELACGARTPSQLGADLRLAVESMRAVLVKLGGRIRDQIPVPRIEDLRVEGDQAVE